jgi:hypothetical protein
MRLISSSLLSNEIFIPYITFSCCNSLARNLSYLCRRIKPLISNFERLISEGNMLKVLVSIPVLLTIGMLSVGSAQAKPELTQPPCTGICKKAPPQSRNVGRALLDQRFAVVNSNGTLARGNGVVSTSQLSTTAYQVIFNRNVTGCAYTATVGKPGSGATEGLAMVAARSGNANGVFVNTRDSKGNGASRDFHLLVTC